MDNINVDRKNSGVRVWIIFIYLRIGEIGGFCEYDNEHSGYMKDGGLLAYLNYSCNF
jgi:hypothetical protein